ncbi:DUF3606 domain-containing protein [Chitinophaga defluvii]|uniref:DUF3606 domain-containing protein n=1 Tax=Chitinophaga defluvii TaxID=3163343 RepID=A0ABV2TDD9_9BACT
MSDNKTKKDARDRNQVAANEKYEVDYIAKELNVSPEQVIKAIQKVGNDRHKIIMELKGK